MSRLIFNGVEIPISRKNQTVLEAIEEFGFFVPSSCLSGRCNFCLLKLEGGEVCSSSQYNLSEKRLKKKMFKSCVAKAQGNIVCNDKL